MPKQRPTEYKGIPAFVVKADETSGIVDAIVSVFGIIDAGDDQIEAGAFLKTITERTRKIRVLNHHNSWDIRDVIGVCLSITEVGRDGLPAEILARFPEATGGLLTSTQYLMNTPEGKGAFDRINAGAIDEYSIGFQVMQAEYKKVPLGDGKARDIRVIREIKLWEYSPVIWGMNPATATVGAKQEFATGGIVSLSLPLIFGGGKDEKEMFVPSTHTILIKAGRVLSDANAKRVLDAWKALGDVLVAAGIALAEDVDSDATVEEEGSKAKRAEPGTPLTPPASEPSADTLKTGRERLLQLIALSEGEGL